jgi:hypothetical protein
VVRENKLTDETSKHGRSDLMDLQVELRWEMILYAINAHACMWLGYSRRDFPMQSLRAVSQPYNGTTQATSAACKYTY